MSDEHKQYASTSAATLEAHILSVHSAKSEAEWWAHREILRLSAENEKLRVALNALIEAATEATEDLIFGEWWKEELAAAAAALKETGDE